MDKDILKTLETLEEGNPFASFLDKTSMSRVDSWIDTGSYVLNGIMSGKLKDGGIPMGRVTMLYGESQTGKSLFIQKILANAQKKGLVAVIFDTENAIDAESAERLGLDTSKVKYVPVFNVEQCRNSIHKFLTAVRENNLEGKFIIAIDSLGNLQSSIENNRIEKDSTSVDMGTRARAIKSLMQTCTQLAAITKTGIVITNHVYDNPGDMHPSLIKTMSGGKSVVYMPSLSVQLSRKPVKEDEMKSETGSTAALQKNYVGILLRALTAKNRFIKQYLQGEIYLSFNTGVDKYHGLLELAVGLDVIQQTGSTYVFAGEKIGYAKTFLNNSEFWENKIIPLLEKRIKEEWVYSANQDAEIKKMELEVEAELETL
jgi:recombination protein RecA